jgi:hypothetical protein
MNSYIILSYIVWTMQRVSVKLLRKLKPVWNCIKRFIHAGSYDQVVGMLYQFPSSFSPSSAEFRAHGGCAMKSDNFCCDFRYLNTGICWFWVAISVMLSHCMYVLFFSPRNHLVCKWKKFSCLFILEVASQVYISLRLVSFRLFQLSMHI